MTITREDYASMDPEDAIDELYAMARSLATQAASQKLLRAQSGYTEDQLKEHTEWWIETAQIAARLKATPAPAPQPPPADQPCGHDVSDPGQSPCRCLRPFGHLGPHECGHNLGRFRSQQ